MTVRFCHCHAGSNISVVILPPVHAAKSEICLKQSAYDFNVPTEDAKYIKCTVLCIKQYQYGFQGSVRGVLNDAIVAHCVLWQRSDFPEECTTLLSIYWQTRQWRAKSRAATRAVWEAGQSVFLFFSLRFHLWSLMFDLGWPVCYCSVSVCVYVLLLQHVCAVITVCVFLIYVVLRTSTKVCILLAEWGHYWEVREFWLVLTSSTDCLRVKTRF